MRPVPKQPAYRYVPEPTNNAHVVAWLIRQRNEQLRAGPTPRAPKAPTALPPSLRGHVLTGLELQARDGDDCTRREVAEVIELRPARVEAETVAEGSELFDHFGVTEEVMTMEMQRTERPLDRARQILDRRTELTRELAGVEAELAELREDLRRDPYVEAMLALLGQAQPPTPTTDRAGRLRRGGRLAQVEAQLTAEPRSYREIARAIGQRETDCNACLQMLVKRGKALKTGPGMFRRAS